MTRKSIFNPALRPASGGAFGAEQAGASPSLILPSQHLCETRRGDLAFSLGRLRFRCGRPMLVEHLGGLFLEHTLCGRVLTCGYGDEFDIMHVFAPEQG